MKAKPIRSVRQNGTPYYCLSDFLRLLHQKGITKTTENAALTDKLTRARGQFKSIYQEGELFFHWVQIEDIFLAVKPHLVNKSDYSNRNSLLRKLFFFIDDCHGTFRDYDRASVLSYFQEVNQHPALTEH